jgi:hypothetical protein
MEIAAPLTGLARTVALAEAQTKWMTNALKTATLAREVAGEILSAILPDLSLLDHFGREAWADRAQGGHLRPWRSSTTPDAVC